MATGAVYVILRNGAGVRQESEVRRQEVTLEQIAWNGVCDVSIRHPQVRSKV
jgi:hypothetical protein